MTRAPSIATAARSSRRDGLLATLALAVTVAAAVLAVGVHRIPAAMLRPIAAPAYPHALAAPRSLVERSVDGSPPEVLHRTPTADRSDGKTPIAPATTWLAP